MAQRETRLVKRMKDAVQGQWPDAFVEKIHGGPYQRAGLPDLLVIIDGMTFGIEAKAPAPGESDEHARGRVTAVQEACLAEMARAGAVTFVAISEGEVLDGIAAGLRERER